MDNNQRILNAKIDSNDSQNPCIILAGASGDLGQRIALNLVRSGANVKGLIRKGSKGKLDNLLKEGVRIAEVDYSSHRDLLKECSGGTCLVSAVSGLRDVIIDVQMQLLKASIEAGIPRFIPSDFCIDYTKLEPGGNRNLDLRREFNQQLNGASIAGTSILNGMFAELLTTHAPVILKKIRRVMYWGNADQPLDFTTIDNTAAFTAAAALDPSTPRYLRVAGEVATVRDLLKIASSAYGQPYKLLRLGPLGLFKTMIGLTRTLAPQKNEVFPAWQGMQYLYDMFTGLPKLQPLNNDRYQGIRWTSLREVLKQSTL